MYNINYVFSQANKLYKNEFEFENDYDKGCILNEIISMPLSVYASYSFFYTYQGEDSIKGTTAFWVNNQYLPEVLRVHSDFTVGQACHILMERLAAGSYKDNISFLFSDPVNLTLFYLLLRPGMFMWTEVQSNDKAKIAPAFHKMKLTQAQTEILAVHDKHYSAFPFYHHPTDYKNASILDRRLHNYASIYKRRFQNTFIIALFYMNISDLYDGACVETTHFTSEAEKFRLTNLVDSPDIQRSDKFNWKLLDKLPYDSYIIQVFENNLKYSPDENHNCHFFLKPGIVDAFFERIIALIDIVYCDYVSTYGSKSW